MNSPFGSLLCLGLTLAASAQTRTPVLVELFTSEGCSSCPPADALLLQLQQAQPISGAEIIALGEHVDYWDALGWRDRFSSHALTERQSQYAALFHRDDVYTPQMVVNGNVEFVGNDAARARQVIAAATRTPKLTLTLATPTHSGHRVSSSVTVAPVPYANDADLFAALVEPEATTNVRSGENGGRTLRHVSVVRSLSRVGRLGPAAGSLAFSVEAPSDTDPATLRLVVFAQARYPGRTLGPILGTAWAPLP